MLSLLVTAWTTAPPGNSGQEFATFKTDKTLAALEQCLKNKLSARGDVTTIKVDGITTLMLRNSTKSPMLMDLDPPSVTLTTRLAYGTRNLIKACL